MADANKKVDEPSKDELEAEKKALEETPDEEIRNSIIEEFELDETDDSDKIDKLVEKEKTHRKTLSTAIRQKIGYREDLKGHTDPKKLEDTPPLSGDKKEKIDNSDFVTKEEMATRDLEALGLSEELAQEVKDYASLKNLTIKKAAESDYIKHLKEKEEQKEKLEEAGISRKKEKKPPVRGDFDREKLGDGLDLSTKEGQEEFEERKKTLKEEGR